MSLIDLVASLVGPALQLWLAGVMVRRKLHRQFPLFFGYTLYSIIVIGVRLSAVKQPRMLFALYWITDIIYGALALLAIREVFGDVLKLRSNRNPWWRFISTAVLLALIIASLWRAIYHPFGPNFWGTLGAGAYSFELGVLCIQAITYLLALFRLQGFSGILKKQHNAAILKGFGIFGLIAMIVYFTRFYFGAQFEGWFRYIPPGAYAMATLTWLAAFRRPESPSSASPPTPEFLDGLVEGFNRDHETLKKIEKNLPPRRHLTGDTGDQYGGVLPASGPAQNQEVFGRSTIRKGFSGPGQECPQT